MKEFHLLQCKCKASNSFIKRCLMLAIEIIYFPKKKVLTAFFQVNGCNRILGCCTRMSTADCERTKKHEYTRGIFLSTVAEHPLSGKLYFLPKAQIWEQRWTEQQTVARKVWCAVTGVTRHEWRRVSRKETMLDLKRWDGHWQANYERIIHEENLRHR